MIARSRKFYHRRRRYEPPSPVSQVLSIVDSRLSHARYQAKSVAAYRKSLKSLVSDDSFWKQLEGLRSNVEKLKASIEDLI